MKHFRYTETAQQMSELFKDRPSTPLDTAIYWIEYVIRHKGAPQMRSAGADLYWYQYYLVDVCCLFFGAIISVAYTVHQVITRLTQKLKCS